MKDCELIFTIHCVGFVRRIVLCCMDRVASAASWRCCVISHIGRRAVSGRGKSGGCRAGNPGRVENYPDGNAGCCRLKDFRYILPFSWKIIFRSIVGFKFYGIIIFFINPQSIKRRIFFSLFSFVLVLKYIKSSLLSIIIVFHVSSKSFWLKRMSCI